MQLSEGAEVEIQIVRVELEALCDVVNRLLQLHQRDADVLDFFRRQRLLFQAPDGLPLHELADQFDEAEDELDDRLLNVFGIRIPSQRRGTAPPARPSGSRAKAGRSGAAASWCSSAFLRRTAGLHAVERFALPSFAGGVPITFLISLIRSCGRHGLVMTTSQPALFALSECPAIA